MERTFGVELEIVGITRSQAIVALQSVGINVQDEGYNHTTRSHWKIVSDSSVQGGFELVSPILHGESGLTALATAATALDDAGATVNRSCGLHVHFDASALTVENVRTIVTRYATYESQIDAFMPLSRRADNNLYCHSLQEIVDDTDFNQATTLQALAQAQVSRYYKVNLQSYLVHGTIEFRQHSGTVNAAKAVNWVRFLDAFISQSIAPVAAEQAATLPALRGVQAELASLFINGPVTLENMEVRFGWLTHTARAAVTRLRKVGMNITVTRINGQAAYVWQHSASVCDSLYAGMNADIVSFYQNRTAVFARA